MMESSDQKPRLLFINRSYWPDAEATGQLLTDLCESLAHQFSVSVLCGQPNSNPTAADFSREGDEVRHHVTIHRLRHTQFNKGQSLGRMANLASFTWAARKWLRSHGDYDFVITETDPFLLPLVASPHCRRTKTKYIAYLQDIYPDIAIRLGKARDGAFTRSLRRRLLAAYQHAVQVVVLSDAMKRELIGWGVEPDRIITIPNWVDCQSITPQKLDNPFRHANGWQDRFVVMHSGNMGMSQRLDALIEAVDEAAFPDHARLALVGGGADEPRLRRMAAERRRHQHVHFLPYQSRESLSTSLSAADLHVISVDPRIGGTLMPSKLYGILATGTPVLAIADPSSDIAKIVQEHSIGVVAGSHDPCLIAEKVGEMAQGGSRNQMAIQRRARHLAETKYDRTICTHMFKEMLLSHLEPIRKGV